MHSLPPDNFHLVRYDTCPVRKPRPEVDPREIRRYESFDVSKRCEEDANHKSLMNGHLGMQQKKETRILTRHSEIQEEPDDTCFDC